MSKASMIEMKVRSLTVDPFTDLPLLLLTDFEGRLEVAIAIGVGEAPAIASELANVELSRPMPHDLMKTMLGQCGARVQHVEIRDLRKETFYAAIIVSLGPGSHETITIDARPSDAIALALRTRASIKVARKVVDRSRRLALQRRRRHLGLPTCDPGSDVFDPEIIDGWLLETLRDEDFGKWKM